MDPGAELEKTHKICGAVIAYFEREVQKSSYTDMSGCSEPWYWIICPHCGDKVEVAKPKHL